MPSNALLLLVLAFILSSICTHKSDGKVAVSVPLDLGCSNGRKQGLLQHRDVSACKGSWTGHVQNANNICSEGWHVCNWNDTVMLSAITFYQTSHVDGCYALNAAQNNGLCQECTSQSDELAGIGADCPITKETGDSCFGKGRIDSSCCSESHAHQACDFRPWMLGVVCCRDKPKGIAPNITESPKSSIRAELREEVVLQCKVTGSPAPHIIWYKNGYPVSTEGLVDVVKTEGGITLSKLTISQSSVKYDGLYLCRAENSYGYAISYTSDVTTYEPKPGVVACKNPKYQQLFYGGKVAACAGRWKGSVKRAGKQLCVKGWRVCGLKDRYVLHKLSWEEITSTSGCFAYNAATSNHFACTRCSHKQKGNSMSGIGADCGMREQEMSSCLSTGRIDVWASKNETTSEVQASARNSCSYEKGVTSGVMCCKVKDKKKKKKQRGSKRGKKGKKCTTPCGPNSHCNRRGDCKCDKGFKSVGDSCQAKKKGKEKGKRRCSNVKCHNGGRCRRGKCECPPAYSGRYCESVIR